LFALSVTCSDPVRVPTAVGLKTTLIVHVPAAANVVVHVFVETR